MARKKPTTTDLTDQSVALAEFAAKTLIAAEQLAIKKRIVKRKLAKREATFTIVGGYAEFLEAIRDKMHEERAAMFEWVSGWFDPEEFDPATKAMKKGLPDWKREAL
jgi:Plasmid pRiA4b ORF-3-like protein